MSYGKMSYEEWRRDLDACEAATASPQRERWRAALAEVELLNERYASLVQELTEGLKTRGHWVAPRGPSPDGWRMIQSVAAALDRLQGDNAALLRVAQAARRCMRIRAADTRDKEERLELMQALTDLGAP